MGRLIDIDVLFDYFGNDAIDKTTRSNIEYFVSEKGTVDAIPKAEIKKFLEEGIKDVNNNVLAIVREDYIHKADYENRLKIDMVAMLTDLQLEIEECVDGAEGSPQFEQGVTTARVQVVEIIQQIINELPQEPTTKNDLGVDCISRQAAITFVCKNTKEILKDTMPLEVKLSSDYIYENVAKIMRNPKVLPPVTPQEPFKPMVEIDLDYVIRQKYIEREVLDKIRAEIETKYGRCTLVEYFVQYDGICTGRKDIGDIADILQIIDKYKTESEG